MFDIDVTLLLASFQYWLMGIFSIMFVRYNAYLAQQVTPNGNDSSSSVKSFIFPIFVKILYFQVFAGIYAGIILLVTPFSQDANYTVSEALLYTSSRTLQRGISICMLICILFMKHSLR